LYKFLNETIRQIDLAVSSENSKKETLFANKDHSIQFSESYLSYMNRYSNNLINFSSPVQIDLPSNDSLYNFLFKKYIDANGSVQKKTKTVEKVKEEFYPKIKTYYNTDKEITTAEIPKLLMSVNVDIMDAYEKNRSHSFLIGNEPDKTAFPKSHEAWNDLRKWNKSTYLPLDEIEQVKEYAVEHGVQPLFV
jgi:hypothetical protein